MDERMHFISLLKPSSFGLLIRSFALIPRLSASGNNQLAIPMGNLAALSVSPLVFFFISPEGRAVISGAALTSAVFWRINSAPREPRKIVLC